MSVVTQKREDIQTLREKIAMYNSCIEQKYTEIQVLAKETEVLMSKNEATYNTFLQSVNMAELQQAMQKAEEIKKLIDNNLLMLTAKGKFFDTQIELKKEQQNVSGLNMLQEQHYALVDQLFAGIEQQYNRMMALYKKCVQKKTNSGK